MVRFLLFPAMLCAGLSACRAAPPEQSGAAIYDANCAQCHGTALRGDGRLAAQLPLSPPDLTLLANRNGGVFPMMDVLTQIHGYPGRFHSGLMPEFDSALSSDQVIWTAPNGEKTPVPRSILLVAQYVETHQR